MSDKGRDIADDVKMSRCRAEKNAANCGKPACRRREVRGRTRRTTRQESVPYRVDLRDPEGKRRAVAKNKSEVRFRVWHINFLGKVASSAAISDTSPKTAPPSSACATIAASRGTSPLLVPRLALLLPSSVTHAVELDTSKVLISTYSARCPISIRPPAECPSLRVQQSGNQKCYNCGRFGHFARACPSGSGGNGFASRAPPPGRALNTSTLPPVKCYRCGGPNHMAKDCLAPGTTAADSVPTGPAAKPKTCYKCQQEGHIARDCPDTAEFIENWGACQGEPRKRFFCLESFAGKFVDATSIPTNMYKQRSVLVQGPPGTSEMLPRSFSGTKLLRWSLYAPRRPIFSLPDLSSMSPFGGQPDTQKYHERKILPYSQRQLYDVVSDVASYPRFIPFCTGSRILRSLAPKPGFPGKLTMDAELTVGFLSFEESYVSKVTCVPDESVEASPFPTVSSTILTSIDPQAVASSSTPLFKTLATIWRFQPASPQSPHPSTIPLHLHREQHGPTLVTLDLVYAFASPIHAGVSATFFGQVSKLMVKAFEERCLSIYGPGQR
ncbi:hypothetical protein NP233_g3764 [Leucocoprinus birnbaumii]|uniref:CCHC-type domain-containing protein n=1 Tax=Leucocoprinus birnbaumii TaxID=56174 RepID=A0AAD5VXD9_9AGAR|nr:hypothetical protein NP233_g3764 [Leucocoprinus birnbaumii]